MSDESPSSGGGWAAKFSEKLHAKQQAKLEARRDYASYQEAVQTLFDRIATKVAGIEQLTVIRPKPIGVRGEQYRESPSAQPEAAKTMTMRCEGKTLEFIPEGINFDYGKGRLRINHKLKTLPVYIFLYLAVDPASAEPYPQNLRWVVSDGGPEQPVEDYAPFDEARIEQLIEAAFLCEEDA